MQHPQLPRRKLGNVEGRTRDIAAGPIKAGDEADLHRVAYDQENNGNGRGCRLGGERPGVGLVSMSATWQRTRSAAIAGSRSYWPFAQRYSGPDILMLDIAGVVQALAECAERIRAAGGLACPCFWAYFGIDSAVGDDLGIAFCTGRKNQHSPMRRSVRWMPCARNC